MSKNLDALINKLKSARGIAKKNQLLDKEKNVVNFLKSHAFVKSLLAGLPPNYEYALKILMAINQARIILRDVKNIPSHFSLLKELCQTLLAIEDFYHPIGGIAGYHNQFIKLLKETSLNQNVKYSEPEFIDIRRLNKNIKGFIKTGLEHLDRFALICPMGGAGDRLNLFDAKTRSPLPSAILNFNGYTLIEHLIRDIQALEYLYFKTFKRQVLTPLVIMTSDEKHNHDLILSIFEKNNWFSRDKKSIYFINQPSVPLLTQDGEWASQSFLKLALKPSGHGVLWHLMNKTKTFDFLKSHKRDKALIRQINNPIAGTDYLLLAFMGIAIKNKKSFGFVSCSGSPGYKEGINTLREEKLKEGFLYNFSNIEYTEFERLSLQEKLISDTSKYPSNTNILFADLNEIKKTVVRDPLPGLTINLKTNVFIKDQNGRTVQKRAGRLESMMQNIADSIQDHKTEKIKKEEQKSLKTFLILSERSKTISTTKNAFAEGKDFFETPQKCFYDVLSNYHDLLTNCCKIKMPSMPCIKDFFIKGPAFICSMNPMIGPLYSIISQKIKGGTFAYGSEMRLEIAQLLIENLYLKGSLIIQTRLIRNSKKNMYNTSSCVLNNVKIKNLGIDANSDNIYWQNKIKRKQYFKITLGENSQFYAADIEFFNTHELIVPANHKMIVSKQNNKIIYKTEKL